MSSILHFKRFLRASICLAILGFSAEAPAQVDVPKSAYAEGAVDDGDARVETRLILDTLQAKPGGDVRVGVLFDLDPEWHVYWRNSGEAGLATRTELAADGLQLDELRWPAPHVFDMSDEVTTFGYGDQVCSLPPRQSTSIPRASSRYVPKSTIWHARSIASPETGR